MEKKVSIRKIIFILVSIRLTFFLVVFAIVFIMSQQSEKLHKNIYNSLLKYEKSNFVVYYANSHIYYNDTNARFDYDILYIDEDVTIWEDSSSRKTKTLVYYKNELFLIDDSLTGYRYFVSGFDIYSMTNDDESYYRCNFKTKNQTKISKEEYYDAKSGNKYNINMEDSGFNISSSYLDSDISISKQDIIDFLNVKNIAGSTKFHSINYQVSDDTLYIQLYYNYYEIILSYNIVNGIMEIADWFRHYMDENDEISVKFYFFKNKYPVSLERYFVVTAYE